MDSFDLEVSKAQGQRSAEWYKERLGRITSSKAGTWMTKSNSYGAVFRKVEELEAMEKALSSGAMDLEIIELSREIAEKKSENKGTKLLEQKLEKLQSHNLPQVREQLKAAREELFISRYSNACLKYVYSKVAEILTGQMHEVTSWAIAWGEDNEALAIEKLGKYLGKVIEPIGFISYGDYFGGSADGYVGDDIVEIKCPYDPANHVQSILTKKVYNDDHMWQIQNNLLITGKKGCYYATFDPRVTDESLQLNVIYIERDEVMIEQLKERMDEVLELLKTLLNQIENEN